MNNLCLFLFLCLFTGPTLAADRLSGPYDAQVLEVLDGDTFRAKIRVWLGQDIETLVRLDGVDAPEMHGACAHENDLARQAKARLQNLIGEKTVRLRNVRRGKYAGRVLARVSAEDANDISTILSSEKLAAAYRGGKRSSWCKA